MYYKNYKIDNKEHERMLKEAEEEGFAITAIRNNMLQTTTIQIDCENAEEAETCWEQLEYCLSLRGKECKNYK